jgi:hypothetical protein
MAALEAQLVALLEAREVKALVRAMCACARRQLPRAQQIDPYNATIVETAEAWTNDACDDAKVREVAKRAGDTRGGSFPSHCVRVIVAPVDEREDAVRWFAQQLPTTVWMTSDAGRAWTAKVGPLAKVGRDPDAMRQIAAVDAELAELARVSAG